MMHVIKESPDYEVIVVGAGPAGATLAYHLARAGIRVLVLEKERLPRYKTCGGGITVKTARLLDFDISPVVERTITGVAISNRLGRMFIRPADGPLAYMVMRDRFDHFLVERASDAGATVLDGCPVRQVEAGSQSVTVTTWEGHTFYAKLLVGADGANSVVARSLGLMRNIRVGIGLESEVRVTEDDLSRWKDLVLFDLGSIGWGYGWIFPKGDHLSIGVGGPAEHAARIRRYNEEFTAFCRSFLNHYEVFRTQGHRLPIRRPGTPIHGPRTLLIGDAAALVNPLDGEGIYYAIRSAQIAVPCLLQALAGPEPPNLAGYQRAIEAQLMTELHAGWKIMRVYSLAPPLFVHALERSNRLWRAIWRLLRGELSYSDILQKLGRFRWIFELASRAGI